jgi:competence protein ComGC
MVPTKIYLSASFWDILGVVLYIAIPLLMSIKEYRSIILHSEGCNAKIKSVNTQIKKICNHKDLTSKDQFKIQLIASLCVEDETL